jgi:hypothetical protein
MSKKNIKNKGLKLVKTPYGNVYRFELPGATVEFETRQAGNRWMKLTGWGK